MSAHLAYRGVSWALADCDHKPGTWRRDLTRLDSVVYAPDKPNTPLFHCATECAECDKPMRGLFTAWGTVRMTTGVML